MESMSFSPPTEHRLEIAVPLGSRVLVKADLLLTPTPTSGSEASVSSVAHELDRWQGTGIVIIAGNLFDTPGSSDVANTLTAHPRFTDSIRSFLTISGRRVVVIPGSRDVSLLGSAGQALLENAGIEVSTSVVLQCQTGAGVREVLVSAGQSGNSSLAGLLDDERSQPWFDDIDRLEDPALVRRFSSSRTIYRRFSRFLWVPPVVALLAAIITSFTFVATNLERIDRGHRVIVRVTTAPWHLRLLLIVASIVIAEIGVGIVATVLVRRLFKNRAGAVSVPAERGSVAESGTADQTSLDTTRAWLAGGGVGAVVGGMMTASLTHLDAGFFCSPGATADVAREHHGRFGAAPVFVTHRQESGLEIETGADLHVMLLLRDEMLPPQSRIEGLIAGEAARPTPPSAPGVRRVASWPTGGSWPPPPDFAATQRMTRRVRRIGAASIFITGLLDLLMAVVPPLRGRLHTVLTYLPLGVSQSAAVAVAFIGLALVMLSRGVLRGQRRAWLTAVLLLAGSTALHLAHAASFGSVAITIAVLGFLVIQRRRFTGTTDRQSLSAALPVVGIVLGVAISAAFLGVELSNLRTGALPAWPLVLLGVTERLIGLTTVVLPDRIDDFVYPTMLAVGIGVIATLLYLATRPVVDRRLSEHHSGPERKAAQVRARDIVRRHGRGTLDYFALRDDKQFFFYGDSVVAYAVYGGICLVSPDPIGPVAEQTQVWGSFRSFCDAHGWGVAVVGAGEQWLPIYDQCGMRWLYLGDEAVVDPQTFSLDGGKMKGLRQANTRLARYGYTVEFLDPSSIDPARVPVLAELMGMNRRGEDERGFSMMLGRLFDPKDTGLLLTIVADAEGRPAAMCQFVPSPAIGGYSLDLMRRDPGEHPNGLLDYALCQTIAHLKATGATGLSLNFSAFRSILDGEKGSGTTQRIERWGLKKLSSILPIETLWRFNEKYMPIWLARYLVYASPEAFVPTVAASLRAESLTEIPVIGRFLTHDPTNRPGTMVPIDLLSGRPVETNESGGF